MGEILRKAGGFSLKVLEEALLRGLEAREDEPEQGRLAATVLEVDDGIGGLAGVRVGEVESQAFVPGSAIAAVRQVDAGDLLHVSRPSPWG